MIIIMKKNYLKIMATAASVLLLVCCQENEFDLNGPAGLVGDNTIGFALNGGAETRSAVSVSDIAKKGATVTLGSSESGVQFVLEESIIDLNAPVTRGTPVYTENVVDLYDGKMAVKSVLSKETSGIDIYTYDDPSKCYVKSYGENIWAKGTDAGTADNPDKQLKFWMYMPTDISDYGVTLGNNAFGEANGKQTITFDYDSPETVAKQADIIFSARAITESEYNANNKVADVLFHHALTGVKFAIGNEAKDNVTITSVTFNGLHTSASCVVTPRKELQPGDGGVYAYQDNPTGDHSSTEDATVHWTLPTNPVTKEISATFTKTVDFAKGAGTFKEGDVSKGKYPASFSAAGNTNNLNDGNATQTFWLIPQTLTNGVTLTIAYTVNGVEDTWTVNFGEVLGSTWKAGQLRTYTIKVDEVNVKIEDEVTIASDQTTSYTDDKGNTHTIYGGTKSGIVITNTGNTDAFIRVAITGQWVDADGAPVFSFTDFTQQDIIQEIASWYNDQFGTGDGHFGVFDGLVGYTKNNKSGAGNDGWVKGNDGYYYYTTKVAPSATTGTAPFNSYTVTLANVPKIKVAGALQDVHFVMEVSTQAISAKKLDGSDYTWTEAWTNALGNNPSATN